MKIESKRIQIALFCVFLSSTCLHASCSGIGSVTLDTLPSGSVVYSFCETLGQVSLCLNDTFTNEMLYDTLVKQARRYEIAVLAHVDTAFRVSDDGFGAESLVITVDSTITGNLAAREFRFEHLFYEDEMSFLTLKDSTFLAFFDADSVPDFLGLGSPNYCNLNLMGSWGYFVSGDTIVNTGPNAFIGVSASISEVFTHAGIRSQPNSAVHSSAKQPSFHKVVSVAMKRGATSRGESYSIVGKLVVHERHGIVIQRSVRP